MVEMASRRPVVMVTVKMALLLVLLSEVVQGGVLSQAKAADPRIGVKSRTKRATDEQEEENNTEEDGSPGGAVYTRWGRKDCPDDAHCLYNGVIAGGCNFPMEMMCLTNHPTFYPNETTWDEQQLEPPPAWFTGQNLCGVEYGFSQLGIQPAENAVCAVCQVERTTQIVIPGRSTCVDGWRLEYQGYLMVNQENMGVTPICVDVNPKEDRSGTGHSGQVVTLQHALPACESIPCGPYVSQKAITCVVCTK